jgi:hypothetical protein
MTGPWADEILEAFDEIMDSRNNLDRELLVAVAKLCSNENSSEHQEELLQEAERMVKKERDFLWYWTMELEERERMLR